MRGTVLQEFFLAFSSILSSRGEGHTLKTSFSSILCEEKKRITHQLAAHDVGGVVIPVSAADLTHNAVLSNADPSVVRGVVTISMIDSNL